LYREKVAALEEAPADPEIKAEAAEILRSHIERITLAPNDQGTLDIPPVWGSGAPSAHLRGGGGAGDQTCESPVTF
jgi:hypothetical protein